MDLIPGLLLAISEANAREFWLFVGLTAVVGAVAFVLGWIQLARARLIENIPTSRIRSAAQGYVELQGHGRLMPGPEIVAPLSGDRCCWWEFRVQQKQREYRQGRLRTEWKTIEQGTSDELFLLADGTGECVIDPVGAQVVPSVTRKWRGSVRRPQSYPQQRSWLELGDFSYRERLIRYGDPIYALGQFSSQATVRHDQQMLDVSELLAVWKRDRPGLLLRFDTDGDGQISVREWTAAREAALLQVQAERAGLGRAACTPGQGSVTAPDLHVLNRPADRRRPYILSTRSEHELTRGLRWTGVAGVAVASLCGAAATFALLARGIL